MRKVSVTDRNATLAVTYCRVSSTRQKTKGDGLESQNTRCREFARMKGYTVVETFKDDASGSLIDRPGMKLLLAYVRKHRSRGIVVIIDDVSRLARDVKTHIELRAAIAGAGGVLESPSIEFGEDSDSILVENLLATVAQHQRQKNGEQTRNRMRARMQNGYFVFQAPMGYRYERASGRGMMLKRDEPLATILTEALEGFASGQFESQSDVVRFLQDHPLFPKGKLGRVHNSRATLLLNQPVYAGYIAAPDWNVSLRPAQHEGLISFQTYQRIQERIAGNSHLPTRRNLNEEFPLRGFVVCDDCSAPLRSCWSKGRDRYHPYYLCQTRDCASYGKSIRRDKIEGEFAGLVQTLVPRESLFRVARAMFQDLWSHRLTQSEAHTQALKAELGKIERQVSQLLDRIIDATVPSVIAAYEDRIRKLEMDKLAIQERMASGGRPKSTFEDTARTAMLFLSNPWKLWESGVLEQRRMMLKLAFVDRLRYARAEGFRTANLSSPFNVLSAFSGEKRAVVGPAGLEPATRPL